MKKIKIKNDYSPLYHSLIPAGKLGTRGGVRIEGSLARRAKLMEEKKSCAIISS